MAATVSQHTSSVHEPCNFLDEWDNWFAHCTGDELPNLFEDLPDGLASKDGAGPSNLFDDFLDGVDVNLGGDLLDLLDDFPNSAGPSNLFDDILDGADVDLGGDLSDLLDDFTNGANVNAYGDRELRADYEGALTNNNEAVSLSPVTDLGHPYHEHMLQHSYLATTGLTIAQSQLFHFSKSGLQPSWGTQVDGTILDPFAYGTINGLQIDIRHDMAMLQNCERIADSSIAADSLTVATSNTTFDPLQPDRPEDYLPLSAGLAELTFPASPFGPNSRLVTRHPMLGNPMGTISVLEDTPSTQELAPKECTPSNDEKGRNQLRLGWIGYDQSSFTHDTGAPKPIHTCDLPSNRKRGRREPLTESKRKKTAEMRELGSCLLCKMKKKDVLGLPLSFPESVILIKASVTMARHANGVLIPQEFGPRCYRAFVLLLLI